MKNKQLYVSSNAANLLGGYGVVANLAEEASLAFDRDDEDEIVYLVRQYGEDVAVIHVKRLVICVMNTQEHEDLMAKRAARDAAKHTELVECAA